MEDGPYRAQRPTGGRRRAADDPEDVLARYGLLDAPEGGRAARRRAAEQADQAPNGNGWHPGDAPGLPTNGAPRRRRRAAEPDLDEPYRNGHSMPPASGNGGGGRRRALDLDDPAVDDRWPHRAEPLPAPPTGGRRRRADEDEPPEDADAGRRWHREPVESRGAALLGGPGRGLDLEPPYVEDEDAYGTRRRRSPDRDAPLPGDGAELYPFGGTGHGAPYPDDGGPGGPSHPADRRRRALDPADEAGFGPRGQRAADSVAPLPGDDIGFGGPPPPPSAPPRRRATDPDVPLPSDDTELGGPPSGAPRRRRAAEPAFPGDDTEYGAPPPPPGAPRRRRTAEPEPPLAGDDAGFGAPPPPPGAPRRRRAANPEAPLLSDDIEFGGPPPPPGAPHRRRAADPEPPHPGDDAEFGAPPPPPGSTRRRRAAEPDEPQPGSFPGHPVDAAATSALPAAARRRRALDAGDEADLGAPRRRATDPAAPYPGDDAGFGGPPPPPGAPRRRRATEPDGPQPADAAPARRLRAAEPDDPQPDTHRRPLDPGDAHLGATTALPAAAVRGRATGPDSRYPTDDADPAWPGPPPGARATRRRGAGPEAWDATEDSDPGWPARSADATADRRRAAAPRAAESPGDAVAGWPGHPPGTRRATSPDSADGPDRSAPPADARRRASGPEPHEPYEDAAPGRLDRPRGTRRRAAALGSPGPADDPGWPAHPADATATRRRAAGSEPDEPFEDGDAGWPAHPGDARGRAPAADAPYPVDGPGRPAHPADAAPRRRATGPEPPEPSEGFDPDWTGRPAGTRRRAGAPDTPGPDGDAAPRWPAAGRRAADPEAYEPSEGSGPGRPVHPTGTRRRAGAPDPDDDAVPGWPAASAATAGRRTPAPEAYEPPEGSGPPARPAGIRRRAGAPDTPDPDDAGWPAAGPPATRRGRGPAAEAQPPTGAGRPRRASGTPRPADDAEPGPPPGGAAATTAIPAAARRRTTDPDDPHAPGSRPADPAAAARTSRRRPALAPDAPHPDDGPGHGDDAAPPTTALPAGGAPKRRRPDPAADAPAAAATTAIPVRRRGEPDAPATTALPTTRRPGTPASEPEGAKAPETTVLPTGGGRAARAGEGPDGKPEPDLDARTRAMRIDETLTRLTAAHAGLTLAVTDRPPPEPSAPPRRSGPAAVAGRVLAGALALVVLAATAFGWGTKTWLGGAVRDAAALDPNSSAVVDAAAQAGDENVLVVAGEPAADEGGPRADTVAVAHIPDGGGPVTVLAFPLDLEINRPPCETWDAATASYREEPVQAEARTQLVSALDLGGPRCITRVVQQLSGLAITKYVGVDLSKVPAMTDAVGGAEICVPRPVLDQVLGPVVPEPGQTRLAGVRVGDYVQAGDVEGEVSPEYGRIERQQQVLAAVLDSAVSGTALLDVGRLMALRPALGDAVLTDEAGLDQVLALSMTLRRLDADGVQYAAVPTAEQNSRGNTVMRDADAAALFAAVRADEPLPEGATDPGGGSAGISPSEVSVQVVNASTRSGLAGQVSETLSSLGFDVGEPESADQPTSETVIRFSPDQAAEAEMLRSTVPSATEVPDPGSTGVLQLVLGQSFDDVVRAPSEPIALSAPTAEAPAAPAVTCA